MRPGVRQLAASVAALLPLAQGGCASAVCLKAVTGAADFAVVVPTRVLVAPGGPPFTLQVDYADGGPGGGVVARKDGPPLAVSLSPVPRGPVAEGLSWSRVGLDYRRRGRVVRRLEVARIRYAALALPVLVAVTLIPLAVAVDAATLPLQALGFLVWISS